ncbi:type II secretion system F family protein [Cellulomonas hominis]
MTALLVVLVAGAVLLGVPATGTATRLRRLDPHGDGARGVMPLRRGSGVIAGSVGADAAEMPTVSGRTGLTGPTGRLGRVVPAGDMPTGTPAVDDRADPPAADGPADVVLLLDLLDAAVTTGAGIPHALRAVGAAVRGPDQRWLAEAGTALLLGAPWSDAWARAPDRLHPVASALEQAWTLGAAPGVGLRRRAASLRRDRRRAAREAAGRLGVLLVLPLGLCFLPAFVLTGLLPVLISLGDGLLG